MGELHDQLDALEKEIESEKVRCDKKWRQEQKFAKQQIEICVGIQELQYKIQQLQEEIAERIVAITTAAAPAPPPVPCAVQQPLTAAQLPAILAFIKDTLAKAPSVDATLSAPRKILGQELRDGIQAFE